MTAGRVDLLPSGPVGRCSGGSGSHWVGGLVLSSFRARSSRRKLRAVSSDLVAGGGEGVLSSWVVGVEAGVGTWVSGGGVAASSSGLRYRLSFACSHSAHWNE